MKVGAEHSKDRESRAQPSRLRVERPETWLLPQRGTLVACDSGWLAAARGEIMELDDPMS